MTDQQMYARFVAGGSADNGRFFAGVQPTGSYCLPACKARKPKRAKVQFFPSCEAARAAGFRACHQCRPDDFAGGADSVLERVESLVAEIRENPGAFADGRAIVERSGFTAPRLAELFREHFHATPADLLVRARVQAAQSRLLTTEAGAAAIGVAVGFEAIPLFRQRFQALTGLTPEAYRALRQASRFTVALPPDYPLAYLRRALGRDPQSVTERLEGDTYTVATHFAGRVGLLTMELGPDAVTVSVEAETKFKASERPAVAAHQMAVGLLGLDQDAAAFARRARRLGLSRLVAGRLGLRLAQTPRVYDGLMWSIIGQQINLAFACLLRRRLAELAGVPAGRGLRTTPTAAAVAQLGPEALLAIQFSRQKAAYLIGASQLVVAGQLRLEELRAGSATRAERALSAVRGLGPWSVNYIMMRALGFPDCTPYGDTSLTSGLQTLFRLEERPGIDATRRLMAAFAPHRSLATAHLWQINQLPL